MNTPYDSFEEGWTPNPIDTKIEEIKTLLKAEIDEETAHQLEYDKELIASRDRQIRELKSNMLDMAVELENLRETVGTEKILLKLSDILRKKINKDNIRKFMEFLFERDDSEFCEHVCVELMCNYYSHKEDILSLLAFFDIPVISNIENFRLPIDYTEEEIAIIIKNVYGTSNCNGTYYKDNLKYATSSLTKPIKSVSSYDNIMWQYVLQNPFVLNHLEEIAINLNRSKYIIFARLDKYQELNDEQKKILLRGLTPEMFKRKNDNKEWQEFALRNIHLIEDNQIFSQLAANLDPYDIRYNRKYIGFPKHIRKTLYDKLNICELCEMVKDEKASAKDRLEILDYINKKMELKVEVEDTINECI